MSHPESDLMKHIQFLHSENLQIRIEKMMFESFLVYAKEQNELQNNYLNFVKKAINQTSSSIEKHKAIRSVIKDSTRSITCGDFDRIQLFVKALVECERKKFEKMKQENVIKKEKCTEMFTKNLPNYDTLQQWNSANAENEKKLSKLMRQRILAEKRLEKKMQIESVLFQQSIVEIATHFVTYKQHMKSSIIKDSPNLIRLEDSLRPKIKPIRSIQVNKTPHHLNKPSTSKDSLYQSNLLSQISTESLTSNQQAIKNDQRTSKNQSETNELTRIVPDVGKRVQDKQRGGEKLDNKSVALEKNANEVEEPFEFNFKIDFSKLAAVFQSPMPTPSNESDRSDRSAPKRPYTLLKEDQEVNSPLLEEEQIFKRPRLKSTTKSQSASKNVNNDSFSSEMVDLCQKPATDAPKSILKAKTVTIISPSPGKESLNLSKSDGTFQECYSMNRQENDLDRHDSIGNSQYTSDDIDKIPNTSFDESSNRLIADNTGFADFFANMQNDISPDVTRNDTLLGINVADDDFDDFFKN